MHEELRIHLLWVNGGGVGWVLEKFLGYEKNLFRIYHFADSFCNNNPTNSIWRAEKEKKTSKGYFKVNGRSSPTMHEDHDARIFLQSMTFASAPKDTAAASPNAVGACDRPWGNWWCNYSKIKCNYYDSWQFNGPASATKTKAQTLPELKTPSKLVAN